VPRSTREYPFFISHIHFTILSKGITVATSKSGGSTSNGRDSISKRLGIKKFQNEVVQAGAILSRQRGTPFHPGRGVGRGGDDTLFAMEEGKVQFHYGAGGRRYISIIPL
jgi:large subunit ribosomal protein L27